VVEYLKLRSIKTQIEDEPAVTVRQIALIMYPSAFLDIVD